MYAGKGDENRFDRTVTWSQTRSGETHLVGLESRSARKKQAIFDIYLLFVAICSIWQGALQARSANSWIIGDWLINYSGGFVRRGLTGALFMAIHRATSAPLQWIVFAAQVAVFLTLLVCVRNLTTGIRWSMLMLAVLFSPATLAFTVLDQFAGLRKKLLLFAALAVVISVLLSDRWKDWQLSALLAVFLVVLALSHEALIVAAPYFFAAVFIQKDSLQRAARICAAPFLILGIALALVIPNHGNLQVAQTICSSVGGTEKLDPGVILSKGPLCTGAIASLQLSVKEEHTGIAPWVAGLKSLYGLLAIPTFAPLLLLFYQFYRRNKLHREVLVVLACAALSLPGTAVLFYVGSDWGRWLHIQAMCLMLLAMMIGRKAFVQAPSEAEETRRPLISRLVASTALFLYATAWTLPAIGVDGWENQGYAATVWPAYRAGVLDLKHNVAVAAKKIV